MVDRAWILWKELEDKAQTELIATTGGIDIAIRNSDNMKNLLSVCESNHIRHAILDPQETKERFPGLSIPEGYNTIQTERAGNALKTNSRNHHHFTFKEKKGHMPSQ